jgi:hypothetical protein
MNKAALILATATSPLIPKENIFLARKANAAFLLPVAAALFYSTPSAVMVWHITNKQKKTQATL